MRKFALAFVVFGSLALAGCSNFAPVKANAEPGCSAATTCSKSAADCGGCPVAAAAAAAKKACGDDCSKPCCADN
jgi:outer membrane murein-binding lipoprotein Lpp